METQPAPHEQPILNIIGEKVALGPLRRDLIPLYLKWLNDFAVTRTMSVGLRPMTWEAEEQWYEQTSKSNRDVAFVVYERATLRPVGHTSLNAIDYRHRGAEFGIMIGERASWGQGYGTEVTTLMLDYGFNGLGLHNIRLTVASYNERGIRAYTRAGFRVIGRRREAWRLGGKAYDLILMDCLATEFQSPVLHRLLEESTATEPPA
jgi:diamine N-acetyltransferase